MKILRNNINNIVYFDMNILIELQKNDDLYAKAVKVIEEKHLKVIYSAAHLEEIRERYIVNELEGRKFISFLNKITGHFAVRGLYRDKPLFLVEEDANCCMNRVLANDGNNATNFVEEFDYNYILFNRSIFHDNNISVKLGNLSPDEIFHDEMVKKILQEKQYILYLSLKNDGFCIGDTYNELKAKSFQILEAYIEMLMKILNIVGYRADKNKCLMHSSTHDISHVHYASASEIFITNDKRLIDKAKAVYSYLNVPTKVYSFEEFINS